MKKKTKWQGLLTAILLVSSTASFAKTAKIAGNGERGGNGGGAWVCQNNDALGTLRKIELVDFYEAEKEFNLEIKKQTGLNAQAILNLYKLRIAEIDKILATNLEPYFAKLNQKLNPKDKYTDIVTIDDTLFRIKPSQRWCEGGVVSYQQLANYTNYGSILINEYLFNHKQMSEEERAGLYLHEVVYAFFRDKFNDKDSQRTRRMVGVIASTLTPEQARKESNSIRFSNDVYKMEFKKINAANKSFLMGRSPIESNSSGLDNEVSVTLTKDFYIMKTEFTQSLWVKIMGTNPSKFKNYEHCPGSFEIINGVALCPTNPVENVSCNDEQTLIEKLNQQEGRDIYRLPTEAEWAYAARAGALKSYTFGSVDLNYYYWFYENSVVGENNQTRPVAIKLANAYGLFDMHGNVWEWVQDVYQDNLPGGIDPHVKTGPGRVSDSSICGESDNDRVIRGASFDHSTKYLHSDYRACDDFDQRSDDTGFRLVKDL